MGDSGEMSTMSIRDKKKFFEQEIAHQASSEPIKKGERKFSYLSDHEVEKMRKDDEHKLSETSQDELLKKMTDSTGEQNYTEVVSNLAKSPSVSDLIEHYQQRTHQNKYQKSPISPRNVKNLKPAKSPKSPRGSTNRHDSTRSRKHSNDRETQPTLPNQVMSELKGVLQTVSDGIPVKRIRETTANERLKRRSSEGSNYMHLRSPQSPQNRTPHSPVRGPQSPVRAPQSPQRTPQSPLYSPQHHSNGQNGTQRKADCIKPRPICYEDLDCDSVRSRVMKQRAASLKHNPRRHSEDLPMRGSSEDIRGNGFNPIMDMLRCTSMTESYHEGMLLNRTGSSGTINTSSGSGTLTQSKCAGSNGALNGAGSSGGSGASSSSSNGCSPRTSLEDVSSRADTVLRSPCRDTLRSHTSQKHPSAGSLYSSSEDLYNRVGYAPSSPARSKEFGLSSQRSSETAPPAEYQSLSVNSRPMQIKVRERSRLVDEKISRQVEEQIDEWTGETVLKTIEFIEKTIEHEVETTKQQIMELQIQGHRNGVFRP